MTTHGFVKAGDLLKAAELASRLGVEAAGIDEVLRADVVIAATDSREPVVRGASLGPVPSWSRSARLGRCGSWTTR
jgi:hypothetical protein